MLKLSYLWILVAAAIQAAPPALQPDPPMTCDSCDEWNAPQEPFRIFGNTYYVGVAGLSAVLITSDDGHILLDGGLPQSAALIDKNIRALGFQTTDVRLIVNSHAHYDHAGGIRALQRLSKAAVAASPSGARALEAGVPGDDDPQIGFGADANRFPAVSPVQAVKDGAPLRVGPLAITPHFTPGHTPGSTTWTWRTCEGTRCVDAVYADSLNAVAAPGFRFSGAPGKPGIAESFRRSIARVEQLPCDILIAVHPSFSGMADKLARRKAAPASNPFVEPAACRVYAADAARRLEQRLASEK